MNRNLPRIFVLCPDDNSPIGGIKILYRHVDVLNRIGFDASILHRKKNFRCNWFENSTKISYLRELKHSEIDFLVMAEIYGPTSADYIRFGREMIWESASSRTFKLKGIKKVIFNQNAYYTFSGYSLNKRERATPYRDPELAGMMVVSEDSLAYLSYTFPGLKIHRIHNCIDKKLFFYHERKKNVISFMPRKHGDEALQVINMLKFRDVLQDFEIVPIANKTQKEVAEILGDSLMFLSFGYPEGCPLPPAEAMATGCLVIGYHGFGAREYFRPEFSYPVETGNTLQFAQQVETAIAEYYAEPEKVAQMRKAASDFILAHYSEEREEADILAAWRDIVSLAC